MLIRVEPFLEAIKAHSLINEEIRISRGPQNEHFHSIRKSRLSADAAE